MSTVTFGPLDHRTNNETVKNFCQTFGRVLNCYIKSNQCIVTFADKQHADEFIRTSPHQIDSYSLVNATMKTHLNRPSNPYYPQSTNNSTDDCRLTIRGSAEQLDENNLLRYFSRYGHVRMCLPNLAQGYATITFDDRMSCERILKESRHFLNGRPLTVEPHASSKSISDQSESSKRRKYSESTLDRKSKHETEQSVNEQTRLKNQYEQCMQLYEHEKKQLNEYLTKQQADFAQQVAHYQYLLKQSYDEITIKDKQIEQLKQENKDIDDLLRQTVHDNEQQQIHSKKREEAHSQMKRKYEELYKGYMKLKDNCSTPRDKDSISIINPVSTSKSTIDDMSSSLSSFKCQILLRNLPKRISVKQIQQYAARYGSVIDCYFRDNENDCVIEFNDRTSVDVFMAKRPHMIDGIELLCQRCLPPFELQKLVKRIFIRGTVQQLTESRLSNYFDRYGKVVSCTIPKGKRNNAFTHHGYAFVAFDDEDVVDRIIQDKPHYIDDIELEIEKAEDMGRQRRDSLSPSPSSRSSHSVSMNNNNHNYKRVRRDTPSPPTRRPTRSSEEFAIRHLEDEIHRLREHAVMAKHHFDETVWKLRRELDDERRRHDQLKLDYDLLRRELAHMSSELQPKNPPRHFNSSNKRDLASRH
ncbi:unnamed protein product [Adineta ricciae]|uniref:RRM domain-containing protein n=1 Tax=Adineta ricciae TaxID=249248 RepID=A0A815FDL5_ADIRI|nr:unnamed protein product [Adineta ricciae]CAF1323853.1 unnamed protein product [Adineta ricciae]